MPDGSPGERGKEQGIGDSLTDLTDLLKAYARQELVDPLKGLARFAAVGSAAALLLGIGLVLLVLAGLRALQTETGTTFTGNWSWAPYAFAVVVAVLLAALAITRIKKGGPR